MRERRKHFRVEWNSPAKIYDRHGRFVGQCIVSNFSNSGARITGLDTRIVPDAFILRISPHSRGQDVMLLGVQRTNWEWNSPAKPKAQASQH